MSDLYDVVEKRQVLATENVTMEEVVTRRMIAVGLPELLPQMWMGNSSYVVMQVLNRN